ncbi:MAG: hypothetical protein IJH32_08255, partial [Ruminococcus sp.]|nr:hypothetical protein [Ruminococcus sp.]
RRERAPALHPYETCCGGSVKPPCSIALRFRLCGKFVEVYYGFVITVQIRHQKIVQKASGEFRKISLFFFTNML